MASDMSPDAPSTAAAPSATPAITLRLPSKYMDASSSSSSPSDNTGPSADWLARTWTVTHSTLGMWRSAQNVRISYRPLPADAAGRARNEDRVEYEAKQAAGTSSSPPKVKTVQGTNTASSTAGGSSSFDWRGKGWLFFVTSHWEILGWGERRLGDGQVERWAVTWFAATLFTREGLDYYSDRREGLSSETAAALEEAVADAAWPPALRALAKELQPVAIRLPWATS